MASESASDASADASAANAASLAFEKEKYDDWQDTYGSVQENLSNYYSTLTPEYYEAQGLEQFQKTQQDAMQGVREDLVRRGIADSGIAANIETTAALEAAESKATIRAQAPGIAASEQRQFLQIGLGQNPGASYGQVLSQQASQATSTAQAANQASGQATADAVRVVGTGLADYLNRPTTTPAVDSGGASANYTQDYSNIA